MKNHMAQARRMYSSRSAMIVFLIAAFLVPSSARTQAPDLATTIANEAERRLEQEADDIGVRQQGDPVITDPVVRNELPPPGGPTILLNSVTFAPGSAFLSDAELDAIKARYVGREVDFSGLSALVRDVNDLYAEKGVVTAAAILPPQDLDGGNLTVELVEGQLGTVAVVGERQTRTGFITDRVRLSRGTTVDVPTASQDIIFFNHTNRAQLRLLLQPGASFGFTDLVFGITEPPPRQLQFTIDNEGVASTGEIQGSVFGSYYGFFGIDDTFLIYGLVSEGSRSGTARFELPITPAGTRLSFNGTISSYNVIAGPTRPLNLSGWSNSASISVRQPIIATDRFVLETALTGFQGVSASYSGSVPLVNSETRKVSPGLTVKFFGDNWRFSTSAQLNSATVDDAIAGTSVEYLVGTGSFDGRYDFGNGFNLLGRGGWQTSDTRLLPGSLLFQIGGPGTVRGLPTEGVAGDSGYYTNLELHRRFELQDIAFNGYVFTDFGEVFSTFPARTTLASAGIGAAYDFNNGLRLEGNVAVPLVQAVANQSDATVSIALSFAAF